MAIGRRIRFEGGGFGGDLLPEVAWAGFNVWTRRQPQNLGHHAHRGCWEVCCLLRGQLDQGIAGRVQVWRAGEMIVFPPDVEHSGVDRVVHRCELVYMGVDLNAPLPGLDDTTVAMLRAVFAEIRAVPFPAEEGMLEAFAGLLREGRERHELAPAVCRAHLHRILLGTARAWRAWQRTAAGPAPRSPAITAAIALMRERLAAPLRVAALARAVGLGRSALHERFVAETGLSPAEYHAWLRIERAKELLAGANNATVALALGFASPQHFATAFKRATGRTPGAWRGAGEG